jgi:hypothetical protein
MIGVIERTPIAELIPLGHGFFKGEGALGHRLVRFVIRLSNDGQVFVIRVTETCQTRDVA